MLVWPYVELLAGFPSLALAQIGAFAFSILLYLLWPKYHRGMRKFYVMLAWTQFLALVLIVCVIEWAMFDIASHAQSLSKTF